MISLKVSVPSKVVFSGVLAIGWTFLQYYKAIKINQEFSLKSSLGVHAITDKEKQEERELEEVYCTEQQKKVFGGGKRCSRASCGSAAL